MAGDPGRQVPGEVLEAGPTGGEETRAEDGVDTGCVEDTVTVAVDLEGEALDLAVQLRSGATVRRTEQDASRRTRT